MQESTTATCSSREEGKFARNSNSLQLSNTADMQLRCPPRNSFLTVKNTEQHPHHRNDSSSSTNTYQVQPTFHPSGSPSGSRSQSFSCHTTHYSRHPSLSDLSVEVMQGTSRYRAVAGKSRKSPSAPSANSPARNYDPQRDSLPYHRRNFSRSKSPPASLPTNLEELPIELTEPWAREQLPLGFVNQFQSNQTTQSSHKPDTLHSMAAPRIRAGDISWEMAQSLNVCLAAPVLMTHEEYSAAYPHFDGHNPDYMVYRDRWEAAMVEWKTRAQTRAAPTSRSLLSTPTSLRQSPSVDYRTISPAMMLIDPLPIPISSPKDLGVESSPSIASLTSLDLPPPVFHEDLPATFIHRESVLAFLVSTSRPESLCATPLRDFISIAPDDASSPRQSPKSSQPRRSPMSLHRPPPPQVGRSVTSSPAASMCMPCISDELGREAELESLADAASPMLSWTPKQFRNGTFAQSSFSQCTTLSPASEMIQPFVPVLPFDVSSATPSVLGRSRGGSITASGTIVATSSTVQSTTLPEQPRANRLLVQDQARHLTIDIRAIQSGRGTNTSDSNSVVNASTTVKSFRASSTSPPVLGASQCRFSASLP